MTAGRMNETKYNNDTGIASLSPGSRWNEVYRVLDPIDVGVQGGAIGSVGVGGLLLGGGFSPYLYQRGFAMDDIYKLEVVLANGTIVEASSDQNDDLYQALKGGGASNFGIVTRYDMRTFKRAPIWSTFRQYFEDDSTNAAHIRALKHWTDNPEAYPNGAAFVWWTYRPRENRTVLLSSLSDTSGQAQPPYMEELLGIPGYNASSEGLSNMSTSSQDFQATGYR